MILFLFWTYAFHTNALQYLHCFSMDWLSRKLVLWQIKKYFHLQNEEQVQVQLLGGHSLTCSNLKLRNTIVNLPSAKIHVQLLTINSLSVVYSSGGEEPLKVSLDGAKLVLAFNPSFVEPPPSYTNTKEQLKSFFDAIKSKEMLHHRGFLSEQAYQLKKLIGEFFIKKVSLLIRNVDVSIQYASEGEVHAMGCELGEVNIKQRTVIAHEEDEHRRLKEEEVICSLEAVALYLGISAEEDKIEQLAYNREILRKTKTIRKNYLIEQGKLQLYYNMHRSSLAITLPELNFKLNKLLLVQLLRTVQHLQTHFSDRPALRPGKGESKELDIGGIRVKMREGTRQWWSYVFKRVLQRVEEKKQFNILTNYKYRQYLFYLLYKYTFGATSAIDKAILQYEEKKLAHSIMSTYAMILTRIDLIRNCDSDDEMVSFVNFICGSKLIQELTHKNGLKKLTYDKIKASSNYFNLHNCNEFIRDFANRSNMSITLSIERSVRVECHEGKYDKVLLKEGFTLEPANFFALKDKYIAKFYKKMTEEAQKWERPIYTLEIGKVQFLQNKSELKLDLPSVLVANEAGEAVLKVSGVLLFKESRTIYSSSNKVVLAEKNNFIKVASVFLNLDRSLAQHLRTTAVLLSDNLVQPLSEQQEFDNYLEENIYKRLPKHPYFQSFSDQTTSVEVEKMMIVTSLFEDKQCLAVELTGLDFTSPSSTKPPRLSLEKLAVTRSKISGFDRIRHGRLDKLAVEQESLILENNKPLALTSNKYLRNHNGYNYYESVLDVAIPFLLIQLSFQDLYYFQLLANYWGELLSSDHLFPKRRGKTQSEMRVISLKQHKIDYFEQLNSFTKSSRTRVKLQGIELILYGQNRRAPQNEVLTMLAQGILYENKVYILGADTSFTLFNLFVQNSLGNKTFSRLKLAEIIEQRAPTNQPLIYSNKYEADASSLLLYGLNDGSREEERENHMVRVKIKNQFSMKKFRKNTHIYVVFKPLFIFHSPDYYQIIASSLALIARTALRNHRPSFPARSPQQESDHEILQAKNISEKTVLVCEIERVNLVALHQSDPIYTFSFLDLTVKHETEAYVAKYELLVAQLYVVDISVNCGLYPVVLKAVPLECHFTKYSSDLLKKKERKSALLRITLHNSELFYLNRKIKELTNFIMSHFETAEEEEQRDSRSQQEQSLPRQYPFCYRVEFVKPVIMLLRSSLSQEKMVSEAESLIVANYVEAGEDIEQPNRFFYDASQEHLRNDSFQSCIEIREQEIQFHSFAKAEQGGEEEPIPQIHVSLINYYVYNFQEVSENAVLFTPEIVITLANKHLKASLKTMNINFSADDYRLLIRITEENFAEAPVSYPKDSVETEEKNIGFRSSYVVEELNMALRETIGSQKFGQLIIGNVIGENILYSNGEKEDLITVDKMEYESCINGHLQRIIVKKEGLIGMLSDPHELRSRNISKEETMKKHAEHFADQADSKAEKQFYKDAQKYNFSEQPEKEAEETMVRGKDKGHAKEETNLNRLGKWIGGMCKKCMCCCKTEAHTDRENGSNQEEQNSQKNEECSKEGPLQWENQVDLDESNISSPNEIINFSTKVNPDDYRQQQRKPHSIYLHIRGERSRQKRMYMLVQHLDIYYERNQHLLTLIDFLGRPYQQPERPYYLRDAQFNNYRPFQTLYEVANTSLFAIQKEAIVQRSLQLAVHVLFNMEKVGDPVNGPGKKVMDTDLTFKMMFQDKKTQKRTTLSDLIRVIHEKQSFVSYHNHEPVKNIERLLITGTNSEKGQNNGETVVKFNFPIYIIKSLADLGKSLSSQPKKEVKEAINVREEEKELKPMNKKNVNQQLQLKLQERGKKQPEKKPIAKIVSNTTVKNYFIPKVQISIETKETVSFVKLFLEATHLKSREMAKEKCQAKNQTIDLNAYVEYWNLNLGKFEPFLEKCSFMVQQQHLKQESCENTKLRVITKSQKDHNSYDYRNGLCLNLTTAFFHTYKELELKYILENEKLQVSNEICYDLTKKGTEAYEYMAMRKQLDREDCDSDSFVKRFPEELKNFFGRQFRLQDLTELSKKKSKRNQVLKNRFHVQGLKVFLYHSYLQSRTKLKYIIYRTPFRIFNTTPNRLLLKFRLANRNSKLEKWCHEIPSKDYYSVPEDIYQCDFLVSISARKKSQRDEQLEGQMVSSNKMMEEEGQRTMSVKYLVQMHANKGDYHLMGKHKLNEYLFNLSTLQKLWIDRRDMVLYSNRMTFCVINVKGQCQQHKDKAIEKAKVALYDSWTIAISPIIIYNYTSQSFNLTNCKRKKYELLPSKSVELNEFPPEAKISEVVVEFLEDPVHHEYRLLNGGIGTQIETMLIDRMQSVNFKTIKETYSTCIVEIYPDWLIINETEFEFHLLYEKKEFIVSEKSTSSLAIAEWRDRKNTAMKLKLFDDLNQQGDFHRFGTETNLIDMFMLSRVEDSDVRLLKQEVQNKGCCGRVKDGQKLAYPEKANDERVFKCVEFVVTIQSSPNYSLTKNLTINYKYWIINQMDFEMVIYQYSSGVTFKIQGEEENGVEILRLKPKEQSYLYTYDFLSNQFYLKVRYEGEFIYSNKFPCNQSIGRSLSLKLKKSVNHDIMSSNIAYHESFHHIRIDMEQIKYKNILTFSYIDGEEVKYPFYINNATNYFVKITQNGESFKVKPKKRIPFSWSNLIENTHEIEVEIEGESMTYSLKEKSQEFKPIVIKGDNFANKSSRTISKKLFKREKCLVKWKGLVGEYLVIFDIFAKRLHITSEQSVSLLLSDAERLVYTPNKIEIYFDNREIFEFHPSNESIKEWSQLLRNDLNNNIIDKIYFTIESFENSMIYFIHNLELSDNNDVKTDHQEFIVENFFLSVINSNPLRIQEILLINMENIEIILENRLSSIKQEDKESYLVKKSSQIFKIRKLKINNQLKHALNPVVLSQIKKSNYPFLEIRRQKQNLILWEDRNNNKDQGIEHYKSSIFFLDQAQLIIEGALILQSYNFHKSIEQIQRQYAYDKQEDNVADPNKDKKVQNNQIYIDYLEIKPIKMTISVSFDANMEKQYQFSLVNFLTLIPSGVQNAIITIDSFVFHHVFMEDNRLRQTLRQYYMYQMKKQILFNAGSIQILTPFQLIRGLGVGFTSIFYNPFYQLVNTKEIKSLTSNMLQGFITFFIFILTLGFSVINGIFKFIAVFTKDNNFQTRRQKFRKQIFKSPMDGFSYGARYLARIFKQFFINFTVWPCEYHQKLPCIGLLFGFLLSIFNIIPWVIKMIITIYDFFYVIGLGFISWGYYEENSMKFRSRPIRTFPHKQLLPYDYLTSKGNEIMRKNLIEENDNEEISFISHIESDDQSKYLLLSNYRILYCSHQLTSFKEITLYKIFKVQVGPLKKNESGGIDNLYLTVFLTFPDKLKCICVECNTNSYEIKFKDLRSIRDFLDKLKRNLQQQKIDFNLQDENLKRYQKSIDSASLKKNEKKSSSKENA